MGVVILALKAAGPAIILALAKVLPDLLSRWYAGAPARLEGRRRAEDDTLRGAIAGGDVAGVEDAFSALGV